MSGFPGPHSYSEFARRQPERDREESRQDVPLVPRTPDADDICDAAYLRARLIEAGDRKSARLFEQLADHIRGLQREINELRQSARKEGSSEGK